MNELDKNDPLYPYYVSQLFREFIHSAYTGAKDVKPKIGINTTANCIKSKLKNGKNDALEMNELYRLKTEMVKTLFRYQRQYRNAPYKSIYEHAKAKLPGIHTFEGLMELMFSVKEERAQAKESMSV
jgi:hypothetical protein